MMFFESIQRFPLSRRNAPRRIAADSNGFAAIAPFKSHQREHVEFIGAIGFSASVILGVGLTTFSGRNTGAILAEIATAVTVGAICAFGQYGLHSGALQLFTPA